MRVGLCVLVVLAGCTRSRGSTPISTPSTRAADRAVSSVGPSPYHVIVGGIVRDRAGPVADAQVHVRRGRQPEILGVSDRAGRFRMEVPTTDVVFERLEIFATVTGSTSIPIRVGSGRTFDLELLSASRIIGTLDNPVARVPIHITSPDHPTISELVWVDDDGRFVTDVLPHGDYEVRLAQEAGLQQFAGAHVTIAPPTDALVAHAPPDAWTVFVAHAAGGFVELRGLDDQVVAARICVAGVARFVGVLPGRYRACADRCVGVTAASTPQRVTLD